MFTNATMTFLCTVFFCAWVWRLHLLCFEIDLMFPTLSVNDILRLCTEISLLISVPFSHTATHTYTHAPCPRRDGGHRSQRVQRSPVARLQPWLCMCYWLDLMYLAISFSYFLRRDSFHGFHKDIINYFEKSAWLMKEVLCPNIRENMILSFFLAFCGFSLCSISFGSCCIMVIWWCSRL